jgi:hypothetical protein
MTNPLKNPKARIAALAVVALGAAYFMLRHSSSAAADPTAGLPVAPDTGTLPLGGMGDGIGAADPTATIPGGPGDVIPDNGIWMAGKDLEDALRNATASIQSGDYLPFGGASDPTGGTTAGGDGSPAAPGNYHLTKSARDAGIPVTPLRDVVAPKFRRIFGAPIHPPEHAAGAPSPPTSNVGRGRITDAIGRVTGRHGIQPPPVAPKRKHRATAYRPQIGITQWARTESGANVVTRPAASSIAGVRLPLAFPTVTGPARTSSVAPVRVTTRQQPAATSSRLVTSTQRITLAPTVRAGTRRAE